MSTEKHNGRANSEVVYYLTKIDLNEVGRQMTFVFNIYIFYQKQCLKT